MDLNWKPFPFVTVSCVTAGFVLFSWVMGWGVRKPLFFALWLWPICWILVVALRHYYKWRVCVWVEQEGYEVVTISDRQEEIRCCPRKLSSDQNVFCAEMKERSSGRIRKGWIIFGTYWFGDTLFSLPEVVWEE